MSGLLSHQQRRLRHVEHLFLRNVPKHGDSCVNSSYSLRDPEIGRVIFESEVQPCTQHPTFDPLPMELRYKHKGTKFLLTLVASNDAAGKQVSFECIIDLTKLQFLSKTISLLHELETLPAQTSNSSLVVLLKCTDGVFFPSLVEILPSVGDSAPPPPPLQESREDTADAWDLVDAEVVREEEKRMQRTDSMSFNDLKCTATATFALTRIRSVATHEQSLLRSRINASLSDKECQSQLVSQRLLHEIRCENLKQQILSKKQRLESLKTSNDKLQENCVKRRQNIQDDDEVVHGRALAQQENLLVQKELLQQQKLAVSKARVRILKELATIFPMTNTVICGSRAPDNEAETEEHAVALSQIAHIVVVFSSLFNYALPHPIFLCSSRSYICEHSGVPENRFPLFVARSSDKSQLRKAISLLQDNIAACASVTRNQHQAPGLPLLVGIEKLLENR